ncbi:tyrosine--tRNA ligase [Mobilitalea sibirica]|uniref:Tyrosine--tRNA ligase n=2 Tax=Mobilitalea sibirica TaxID=1462919 RepID=A0A8J7H1X7_9FIRM|nr:tyrosine--tRNA ligase [Mobilitalea sibirica]MBH1940604.1 tyrosine--tRNA ligase [Mobilitalea sibirica]
MVQNNLENKIKIYEIEEQMKIIQKGAAQLISEEELRQKLRNALREKRPLTVKLGLDPSAPDIHLGHAVVLRKIKQMQDLGHQAIIIIGDFTGRIGDPTGKSKTRKPLSQEQVLKNADTYTKQIFKILDPAKTTVRFNSEWLSKLNFEEVIKLASSITVARLLERDDFKSRFRANEPIGLHEFFYPLMQAYDSVEIEADIELGGTDQTFNILMGRNLQSSMELERQIALFMPILEGLDGIEKMSKSLGNYIGIFEPAEVMYKKVMEIPDHLILRYFELATDEHPDKIEEIKKQLKEGKNPRDIKLELANIITGLYHSTQDVQRAKEYFETVFQKGELPEDMPEFSIPTTILSLLDLTPLLLEQGFIKSGSEFRRLILQGGIQINGEKVKDLDYKLDTDIVILRLGKKKFIRLLLN